MVDESKLIEDGKALGFKGVELQEYVSKRMERERTKEAELIERENDRLERLRKKELEEEERKRKKDLDDEAREERLKAREDKRAKEEAERLERRYEQENRNLELKLQVAQLQGEEQSSSVEAGSKNLIKLTPYKQGEDVSVYLRTFDKVCEVNNWTEKVAITALQNGFTNTKVGKFLDSLSSNRSLTLIKADIINSFGLHVYDYMNSFRNAKQNGESFNEFVIGMKENLTKLCLMTEVNEEFHRLSDLMIKEQILRGVDGKLSEYLKERNIFAMDLSDVIKVADNYQAIHGRNNTNQREFSKKQYPQTRNIGGEKICYSCGKTGHTAKFCKGKTNSTFHAVTSNVATNANNEKTRYTEAVCYTCKEKGHIAKDCKKNRKYGKSQNYANERDKVRVHFTLQNTEELKGQLPIALGVCNNQNVKVLRDTGSTAVLVRSDLVNRTDLKNESVTLTFADGRSVAATKAKINLQCVFYTGNTDAICLDNLPFDVLVGNVRGASCACTNVNANLSSNVENIVSNISCAVSTRSNIANENKPDVQTPAATKVIKLDMSHISTKDIIDLQLGDKTLKTCFAKTSNLNKSYPKFAMENGVLVRLSNKSRGAKNIVKQIVLPLTLREKVIALAHDTVMSGHLGVCKTQARVLNHFFWPDVYGDIRRYCRSCEICQRNSIGKPVKVPLINLPVIDTPFKRVAVDIIGPLQKSSKGNRFALVFLDLATKYPDAIPLKRIDSDTIAEALLDIFARVGLPSEILHDRGTQFMSAVMTRFNQLLQIKSIATTAYNPKCNGSCENFNKTLKQMIKKITEDKPETWDRYIQPLLFAYREVPQSSTGFSPFELVMGHEVRGPLFLIKERILSNTTNEEIPVTSYVIQMREHIKQFLKLSNSNELKSKQKEKTYYDKSCRKRSFKIGDQVLLLLPTSPNKLVAEWKGPFSVVRKLNKVDYVVRIDDRERMYHINMLKPFHQRNTSDTIENVISNLTLEPSSSYAVATELSNTDRNAMVELISQFEMVFSKVPGKLTTEEYTIEIDPTIKPIACMPYKIPFHLKEKVKSELDNWLEQGIIVKSNSKFAMPMVIVKNTDSTIRLTVDFRKLNPYVNIDNYPMPDRDAVIEKLYKAKFMTKLDLTKAFFQIPIDKISQKYTSFVTEFGQFAFTVVPFGIRFASGLCSRIINKLLSSHESYITNFVDDLVIFSDSFESHMKHVKAVLSTLASIGVTLNLKKCTFAQSTIKFLGFIIGEGKVFPDPEKVDAIRNFPKPINKKQLRSFLGLLNFYKRFVPHLSNHVAKLTDLLLKTSPDKISWTDNLNYTYKEAVELVSADAALYISNPMHQFVVQTDASQVAIGAVLGQMVDGEMRPISFISRKLTKAERNYAVVEKECLAIKWAIEYFSQYLYAKKFLVKTDHAPLTWLRQCKDKNSRLMRWALALQAYDFVIMYIKGTDNFLADMLSRSPNYGYLDDSQ